MGLDVSGYTIVGIRVKYSDFFTKTGLKLGCSHCGRDGQQNELYCPNDGKKLVKMALEEPTPGFAKYVQSGDDTPEDTYRGLCDTYYDDDDVVGIHAINAIQDGDNDGEIAIGKCIGSTGSIRSSSRAHEVIALPISQLKDIVGDIKAFAEELGIATDREPEIFTAVSVSY